MKYEAQGNLALAKSTLQTLLEHQPDCAEALHRLGLLAYQQGHYAQAAELLADALRLKANAEIAVGLGRALLEQGNIQEAVGRFQDALKLQPDCAEAWYNLGNAHKDAGRIDDAIDAYGAALRLNPKYFQAHNNLGVALQALGRLEEAAASYRTTIRLNPEFPGANYNLGNVLQELGRASDAVVCLGAALRLNPDYAAAHNNLGAILKDQGKTSEALQCFRECLRVNPDDAQAMVNIAAALQELGFLDEAAAYYRRAFAVTRDSSLRISLATLLPPISNSTEQITQARAQYDRGLTELLQEPPFGEPAKTANAATFYLAYHGLPNRDLMVKLARVFQKHLPALDYSAPHCAAARARAGKIKVGFISKFMRNHSIGRTTGGLVAQLSRDKFEVTSVFIPPFGNDEIARAIRDSSDRHVVLPPDFLDARRAVSALGLDVLFYQDVAMEPISYSLAFARLAPVQCISFGHPDTCGIPNMDYWVSNDLFEPEGAQAHYSENLFLLRDLGTLAYYERPQLSPNPKKRGDFGLREDRHIYLCPQTLFKLHPAFDAILAGILRADANGEIVLIANLVPRWAELLKSRFERTMRDCARRVRFLPPLNAQDFLNLIAVSDVMLDTIHFNGMNTSLEAFAVGTPVVTLPTGLQRGRHTCGMYRKMALDAGIADSPEHYVMLAVKLGCDSGYRDQVRMQILARSNVLYEDRRVVLEFERFFEAAVARASERGPARPI